MQCGPVRFKDDARRQADARPFAHHVIPRKTGFRMPQGSGSDKDPSITDIYAALVSDEKRNDMIFDDVLKALEKKRSPVVITERKEHLHCLAERFSRFARNVIVMKGGMGPKQRKSIAEKIARIPDEEERLILATGRYLGEGFDDPRLDTLFLTLPISWKGTLAQYAGRLHRAHDGKSEVIIYDYVDETLPMTMRMFRKRLRGYHAIGYQVEGVDK
jgi:superfamily II DNA or RNA helicase